MFCKYAEPLGIESVASNGLDCKHRPINHIFCPILFTIKQRLTNFARLPARNAIAQDQDVLSHLIALSGGVGVGSGSHTH